MPPRLTRQELLRLARLGAHARLAELRAEVAAIEALLAPAKRRRGRPAKVKAPEATSSKRRRARRRPQWTAAQRQAVAERMKAYWARRKAGIKK